VCAGNTTAAVCVLQVYTVTVKRPISDATLKKFAEGVVITAPVQRDSGSSSSRNSSAKLVTARTLPCEARRLGSRAETFTVTLREGRNRQIRRMCEVLGHSVVSLHRTSFMDITVSVEITPQRAAALSPILYAAV
jgi:23S rRNA pseudouridine2604 synthase